MANAHQDLKPDSSKAIKPDSPRFLKPLTQKGPKMLKLYFLNKNALQPSSPESLQS